MIWTQLNRTINHFGSKNLATYLKHAAVFPQGLQKGQHVNLQPSPRVLICSRSHLACSSSVWSSPIFVQKQRQSQPYQNHSYPIHQHALNLESIRWYTTAQNPKENENIKSSENTALGNKSDSPDLSEKQDEEEKPKGVLARFKDAYKQYGKVLVGVHLVTSSLWFGTFYYAAYTGLDIVPLLKWMNFSERVISPFESSGVGDIAVAYLLYKIATPARYTVTIVGTQYTVRYLRHLGYMQPIPEGSRIRDLVKESREQVKEKYEDFKGDVKDKSEEYKEKYEDRKELYKEKYQDFKEDVKDKREGYRDKYEERKDLYKDKFEERKEKIQEKFKR